MKRLQFGKFYPPNIGGIQYVMFETLEGIAHSSFSDVVVWNPWASGEKELFDMKTNDYQKMICIETARITKSLEKIDEISVKIKNENI